MTPASGSVTGPVKRSARLNASVNPVPFALDSNVEQESPSTTVVNNGGDGSMVDGKDSSVKKDNEGSSRRGRGKGKGISRGRGKGKGKHNFCDSREASYYDVYVFVCLLTSFEIIPGLRDHALRIIIEISV